jgi:hypothetical protein
MFAVMEDRTESVRVMHLMDGHVLCDEMLRWLVRNRLTGVRLLEWLRFEHRGSVFGAMKYLVMRVERERKVRPVIAGIDYFPRRPKIEG